MLMMQYMELFLNLNKNMIQINYMMDGQLHICQHIMVYNHVENGNMILLLKIKKIKLYVIYYAKINYLFQTNGMMINIRKIMK